MVEFLVRVLFLVYKLLLSCCVFTWQRELWSPHPLIRAPIPTCGLYAHDLSKPNDLPKTPPPNTITLAVRVSAYELWQKTQGFHP